VTLSSRSALETTESFHGTTELGTWTQPPNHAKRTHRRTESVISSKIFVGNLNFSTTDEELRALFGEIGEVVDVHIPKDRESGRPRGFAFVRFAAEEHAAEAVEKLHGREVGGRALRLDIAEDRPRAPRPRPNFGPPPDRHSANDYGRGDYDRGGDYGGRSDRSGFDKPKKPKGSRRGLRGKKRSL